MPPSHQSPGAGLAAVLLITRTRPGPRLVFHYPEVPERKVHVHHDEDSDDSDTETDEPVNRPPSSGLAKLALDGNGNGHSGSETVFGHAVETLEKILSPGRWCDQKKFEVCVNGLTFLGHPVYSLADGEWTPKQQEAAANKFKKSSLATQQKYGDYHMYLDPGSLASTPPGARAERDFTHIPESFDSQKGLATSMESGSSTSAVTSEQITMFHVVFAMRSHGMDGQKEIKAMYKEVAKVLSKALHYCQKQSNYVATESRRLLALRTKAKQSESSLHGLWKQMSETSELAWALKEVYDRISTGNVAGIRFNGMEMSLHIAGPNNEDESIEPEPLSALLLLEKKETLLHQLSHPDASPLAHFIREMTPTKNLQKHATNLRMPIKDILYLANHLIKWRKARVITPLHQRNTYVVSPDAPLENLHQLREGYVKLFPTLPSLPNMLKVLSGKPIKFGVLVPSRDHRGAYMDILSYLFRHNLVVQLKTYGWLRIPKRLANAPQPSARASPNRRPISSRGLLSPRLHPVDDDNISVHSDRTTIAVPTSKTTKRLSAGKATDDEKEDFVIVTKPMQPTEEEGKLIEHLQFELGSAEFRENFSLILPHLDGEHAFEEIAARVGLKRSKVEDWLGELEKKRWLMTMRYI